jgi:putative SOS response-associated peptidase YedK
MEQYLFPCPLKTDPGSFSLHLQQYEIPFRQNPDQFITMCGRYSLVCIDDLGNRFRVHNPMIGARSRFNVAPGNEMPVIIRKENNVIVPMRWGLVPHGAEDLKSARTVINARADTLAEKPLFRPLLKYGRCLIPASGFFEWKREGKRRVPYYFHVPESPVFTFAGLSDTWQKPDGKLLAIYTIITCEPNSLVADVHTRMPVILAQENEGRWLSGDPLAPEDLKRILAPFPASAMARVPVSDLVNNPSVDDGRLIQPLGSLSSTQTFLPE